MYHILPDSKMHRVTLTAKALDYKGSITLDWRFMGAIHAAADRRHPHPPSSFAHWPGCY
jgi:aspartate 1-decarboxylase